MIGEINRTNGVKRITSIKITVDEEYFQKYDRLFLECPILEVVSIPKKNEDGTVELELATEAINGVNLYTHARFFDIDPDFLKQVNNEKVF